MKKILIIEDEKLAAEKLIEILQLCLTDTFEYKVIHSVEESIEHLTHKETNYDLGFFDIQLADGDSFDILEECDTRFPILFTTAYDQFILKALENQAIDYILKPVTEDRIRIALEKVDRLERHFNKEHIMPLREAAGPSRFLVKKGTDFRSIPLEEVRYFFSEHKISFLVTRSGEKYIVDRTLAELSDQLRTANYFRLNRQFLICQEAVEKFRPENGKINVFLSPPTSEDLYVSKENAPAFRTWISDEVV